MLRNHFRILKWSVISEKCERSIYFNTFSYFCKIFPQKFPKLMLPSFSYISDFFKMCPRFTENFSDLQNFIEILPKSHNISLSLVLCSLRNFSNFSRINWKITYNFSKAPSGKSEISSKLQNKILITSAQLLFPNISKIFSRFL